jgi:hypothetical protein
MINCGIKLRRFKRLDSLIQLVSGLKFLNHLTARQAERKDRQNSER